MPVMDGLTATRLIREHEECIGSAVNKAKSALAEDVTNSVMKVLNEPPKPSAVSDPQPSCSTCSASITQPTGSCQSKPKDTQLVDTSEGSSGASALLPIPVAPSASAPVTRSANTNISLAKLAAAERFTNSALSKVKDVMTAGVATIGAALTGNVQESGGSCNEKTAAALDRALATGQPNAPDKPEAAQGKQHKPGMLRTPVIALTAGASDEEQTACLRVRIPLRAAFRLPIRCD